jgi:periplasmic protein TonB
MLKIAASNRRISSLYRTLFTVAVLILPALLNRPCTAQNSEGASDRKILSRVEPGYPETLKRLYIGGAVRVQVIVSANGNVEGTELLGGNPIFGQSAMKAIKQWKYAPGKAQEKLVVKLEFDPHE